MRIAFKITHIIIGVLLVLSTAFQLLAMCSGVLLNEYNDLAARIPWLVPIWAVALVLLIAAYVLLVKRGEHFPWQPIIIGGALVGAVLAFVSAITLRDALPDHLIISGETQGLTTWRLLYRHMSSVLTGALIALTATVRWILHHIAVLNTSTDNTAQSTIGLDTFAGDAVPKKQKKLKRSLRRAREKADTNGTNL